MFKKIVFAAVAAAFFIVPWSCPAVKDWAPGLAVLLGIIFSVTWGNPFSEYTSKITSQLLGATIVGMGFGMNLLEVLRAGANGFIYTLIGIALGIGVAAAGGSMGQGAAIKAACEGTARNPDASGKISQSLILGLAFIESLVIYALLVALILLFVKM